MSENSHDTTHPAVLELLEERAFAQKDTYVAGKIHIQKVARTRTISVPVELTEHYLVIKTTPKQADAGDMDNVFIKDDTHAPTVLLNGAPLDGDCEILLSYDVASVHKQTVIAEEVRIDKLINTRTDTLIVDVAREELVIEERHNDL